jgi:hypothetical protein
LEGGGSEGIVHGFLGAVEIAEEPDQSGEDPTGLGAVDRVDVAGSHRFRAHARFAGT